MITPSAFWRRRFHYTVCWWVWKRLRRLRYRIARHGRITRQRWQINSRWPPNWVHWFTRWYLVWRNYWPAAYCQSCNVKNTTENALLLAALTWITALGRFGR